MRPAYKVFWIVSEFKLVYKTYWILAGGLSSGVWLVLAVRDGNWCYLLQSRLQDLVMASQRSTYACA